MKIAFVNNSNASPNDLSGGETIIMNLYKEWSRLPNIELKVLTTNFGRTIWRRHGIDDENIFDILHCRESENLLLSYTKRVFNFCKNQIAHEIISNADVVYTASDFWPDSLSICFMRKKYQQFIWVAGFYLFAPHPFAKDSPYRGKNYLKGLIYYFSQIPVYFLLKSLVDGFYVTSEPDVRRLQGARIKKKDIVVIRGGVDITESSAYLKLSKQIPLSERKYDGVFLGRLHYQKGVLLLVDIWREVIQKRKDAKLAIIGTGPLEKEIRANIRSYGLENNIDLLGFHIGNSKYDIFKNSKIVLHPATYDSGGMAAAEAMAWGLPGISYDLEALKTYYPKGMVKVRPIGDATNYANEVLSLLKDERKYNRYKENAIALIEEEWHWKKRAQDIWESTRPIISEKLKYRERLYQ